MALVALPALALATPVATGPFDGTPMPLDPDAVVLYDQDNNAGPNAVASQDFEAANNAFDCFAGDDFIVPAGETWNVNLVEVNGVYFNGNGPAAAVHIWFYPDAGNLPGPVAEFTAMNQPYAGAGGDFQVALAPAASLSPGHHWLVVQARQDFTPAGQWGFGDRIVVSNAPAVWQNPGGGFGVCPTWAPRGATCGIDPGAPDQTFRLQGERQQTTAVEASTWGLIKSIYTN